MSAANRRARGTRRKRSNGNVDSDFCPTPYDCALACMSLLPIMEGDRVVDAGAGQGVFAQVVHDLYGVPSIAVELYPERYANLAARVQSGVVAELHGQSFLSWSPERKVDWIVGNPPFKLAQRFVEQALFATREGGHVAMLLRHGFAVTDVRADFRRRFPMFRKYDLQTRPSFYSTNAEGTSKSSDATEYALFVWRAGYRGRTINDVLRWNPDGGRGAGREGRFASLVADDIGRIREADWPSYGRAFNEKGVIAPSFIRGVV